MPIDSEAVTNYLNSWNGRIRAALLDFYILYQGAFNTTTLYPYLIRQNLIELWQEDNAPPLQTIYSAINRLEKAGMITITQEIAAGRVQKVITTSPSGFELIPLMETTLQDFKGESLDQLKAIK